MDFLDFVRIQYSTNQARVLNIRVIRPCTWFFYIFPLQTTFKKKAQKYIIKYSNNLI